MDRTETPLDYFFLLCSFIYLKIKLSKCLGNKQLRRIGEWRNSSTHSYPRLLAEVTGQLHNLTTSLSVYHLIEGCVGPRAGMVTVKKRKNLPLAGIEPNWWHSSHCANLLNFFSFLSGCTRRSLAESDDTRGCICAICVVDLLMMGGLRSKYVEEFNFM